MCITVNNRIRQKKELTSPSRASCHGPSEAKCLLATSCRPACRGEGPRGPPPRPGMLVLVLVLPGLLLLWTLGFNLGSFRKKDPTTQIQEGKPAQDVPRFARARAVTSFFEISSCWISIHGRLRVHVLQDGVGSAGVFARSCLRPNRGGACRRIAEFCG